VAMSSSSTHYNNIRMDSLKLYGNPEWKWQFISLRRIYLVNYL
jgi:hypothetical protein